MRIFYQFIINPIKNIENKTKFIEATEDEVKLAISLASESFNNYKEIPGIERSLFLKTIGDEIMKLGDDLIKIYCQESGLPEPRAIGERSRTINQLNSFANLIENENEANQLFDFVINRTSLKPEIKNLIIYKKALYFADSISENELLNILKPIINSKSVWKSHGLYLMAEYFYSKEEKEKAKEFFNKILNIDNANQDIIKEAQKRLNRDLSE